MNDLKLVALMAGIPDYMIGGITGWVEHGIMPGDFLEAAIRNDLCEACGRADDTNRHLLFNYVRFFYNYAPSQCWGSPAKVDAWYEKHEAVRERATVSASEGRS